MHYFESKIFTVAKTNAEYTYQKATGTRINGQYILYVKGAPYIIRRTAKELKAFARMHFAKRASCNFQEPKYEVNYFDPTKI